MSEELKVIQESSKEIVSITYGSDFSTKRYGIVSFTISKAGDGSFDVVKKLAKQCKKQWMEWSKAGELAVQINESDLEASSKNELPKESTEDVEEFLEEKPVVEKKRKRGRPPGSKKKKNVDSENVVKIGSNIKDTDSESAEENQEQEVEKPESLDDDMPEAAFEEFDEVETKDITQKKDTKNIDSDDEIFEEFFDEGSDDASEPDTVENKTNISSDSKKNPYEMNVEELIELCKSVGIEKGYDGKELKECTKAELIISYESELSEDEI